MYELSTTIDIDASAETSWSVLTDFAAYPEWNPFVVRIEGELRVGERLSITLQPPGGKPWDFTPRVTRVDAGRGFSWLGRLVAPMIFDGEHRFELQPREGGVRLQHSERFGGLLVPFMKGMLEGSTRAGFVSMNEAFKTRCENSPASAPSSA